MPVHTYAAIVLLCDTCMRALFSAVYMYVSQMLQGGPAEAQKANDTAEDSAKHIQATKPPSSLQGILPFLPIVVILIAVLAAYQFLGN